MVQGWRGPHQEEPKGEAQHGNCEELDLLPWRRVGDQHCDRHTHLEGPDGGILRLLINMKIVKKYTNRWINQSIDQYVSK